MPGRRSYRAEGPTAISATRCAAAAGEAVEGTPAGCAVGVTDGPAWTTGLAATVAVW